MSEIQITPEVLPSSPAMYGLQGRIEMYNPATKGTDQDVLNINNRKLTVKKEQLGAHKAEFHAVLAHASTEERKQSWKEGTYDEQMDMWRGSFVKAVESRKDYFAAPGQADFFKALGVDTAHFDGNQAQEFYTTYFSAGKTESKTQAFTDSVLKLIQKPDGSYDADKLALHAEGIRCMAMNFGKDGADVIMSAIRADVELANNPDTYVKQIEQAVNTIPADSHEEHLVVYLSDAAQKYKEDEKIKEETKKADNEPLSINKKVVNLTPELSSNNPQVFMESLFKDLNNRYPRLYSVWKFAEKEGIVSPAHLKLDPNNWMSESDSTDGITLGTKPMSKGEKYRIMFNDEAFDYPSEVVYRLSHELSHKLITHIAIKQNQSSEFNHLLSTLKDLNEKRGKVVTALASQEFYRSQGPEVQGKEDMTELVSMYLQDPHYLKQYLSFLSNEDYRDIREKFHLVRLEADTAKALYETVERGLAPLFKEMNKKIEIPPGISNKKEEEKAQKPPATNTPKAPTTVGEPLKPIVIPPKKLDEVEEDKEPEITVLDYKEAENILRVTLPPENSARKSPDTVTLEQKNRIAAHRYIQKLDEMFEEAKKDPKNRTNEMSPDPNGQYVQTPIGFRRIEQPGNPDNKYYDFPNTILTAQNRYKLPLIFLTLGNHANLVLNIKQNPTNHNWNVAVYDPMKRGEGTIDETSGFELQTSSPIKIIEIPNSPDDLGINVTGDEEKSEIWKLLTESRGRSDSHLFTLSNLLSDPQSTKSWHDFVANGGYDLTLQGDADFTDETYAAKAQAFQTSDYHNCIPYSLWAGFIRTAAKYTAEDCPEVYKGFFQEGLAQFERDFGFPIATRKELMANDFVMAR